MTNVPIVRPINVTEEHRSLVDPSRPWKGTRVERTTRLDFETIAWTSGAVIGDWTDVARLSASLIGGQHHETCLAILTKSSVVVAVVRLGEGGPTRVSYSVSDAVACAASFAEFATDAAWHVHNHPGRGTLTPSDADKQSARKWREALAEAGIGFCGSVIVTTKDSSQSIFFDGEQD